MPRSNAGLIADFEAKRIAVNADIRTNVATIGNFLIDCGGDALMGNSGDSDNATYYADKIHPTLVGMTRLVTEWITPAVLANWVD